MAFRFDSARMQQGCMQRGNLGVPAEAAGALVAGAALGTFAASIAAAVDTVAAQAVACQEGSQVNIAGARGKGVVKRRTVWEGVDRCV